MTKVTCEECGKTFYKSPSDIRKSNHNYCSVECRTIARTDYETRNLVYSVLQAHPLPPRKIREYTEKRIQYILKCMKEEELIEKEGDNYVTKD